MLLPCPKMQLVLLLLAASFSHAAVVMTPDATTSISSTTPEADVVATVIIERLHHNRIHCFDHRPAIEHGFYEVVTDDGHMIKPQCDPGFRMVGQDDVRICNETEKKFSGSEPHCEDIDECLLLSNDVEIADDESSSDDYEDGMMPCHPKADCVNDIGSYRCVCWDGLTGSGFQCSEKSDTCLVPEPPAYGVIIPINKNTIRVFCHPDYSIYGHSIVSCNQGNWENMPKCIPGWRSCGDPGVPEGGYRKGNRFQVGSTLRFYCRKGYMLSGSRMRMCLEPQLQWTGTTSTCIDITKEAVYEPVPEYQALKEKILHREKRI